MGGRRHEGAAREDILYFQDESKKCSGNVQGPGSFLIKSQKIPGRIHKKSKTNSQMSQKIIEKTIEMS